MNQPGTMMDMGSTGSVICGSSIHMPNVLPQQRVINTPPFGLNVHDWFKFMASHGKKMSAVRAKIERIAKNGQNQQQNYKYAEAADIYDEVRKILHEENVGFKANVMREWEETIKTRSGEARITKAQLLVTWTDLETGYFEEMNIVGAGLDHGDKGIYKAYTGAEKYALVITFMIPTGDDPAKGAMDPEREFPDNAPERNQDRQQPRNEQKNNNRSSNRSSSNSKAAESRAEASKSKDESKDTKEAESLQEAHDDSGEPIGEELKNEIKIHATILAGYAQEDKKKALSGIYESLKPKLKTTTADVKDYTQGQGREALRYIKAWIEERKKKQKEKEEAIQRQIEAREATAKLQEEQAAAKDEVDPGRGEESQVIDNAE